MKKIILFIVTMFVYTLSYSQAFYNIHDYRKVSQNELKPFLENEEHFWSKVAQLLVKEGKISNWTVLQRETGLDEEPNICFIIGLGSKQNVNELTEKYSKATQQVLASMGKDEAVFVKRALEIDPHRMMLYVLNRTNLETADGDTKYLKINYFNTSNADKMNQLQGKVWGEFIKKSMNTKATTQNWWSTSQVLSPLGNGYNWNYISVDGYPSLEDALDGGWANTPTYPDLTDISKLIGGNAYKSVIWHVLMQVNRKGEFYKN